MNFFEGRIVECGGALFFDEGPGALPVPAVWLVQPLGGTVRAHVATGRHPQVVAQVDASSRLAVGDSVPVHFDSARLHFFEPGALGKPLVEPPRAMPP
ncbi:MAG: TOBE domain-containing protein [Myxococcales bacterium]|nr:TOBE domain-containing protein [Myxococcales bacterium]